MPQSELNHKLYTHHHHWRSLKTCTTVLSIGSSTCWSSGGTFSCLPLRGCCFASVTWWNSSSWCATPSCMTFSQCCPSCPVCSQLLNVIWNFRLVLMLSLKCFFGPPRACCPSLSWDYRTCLGRCVRHVNDMASWSELHYCSGDAEHIGFFQNTDVGAPVLPPDP